MVAIPRLGGETIKTVGGGLLKFSNSFASIFRYNRSFRTGFILFLIILVLGGACPTIRKPFLRLLINVALKLINSK
jgi:hypothetical protein